MTPFIDYCPVPATLYRASRWHISYRFPVALHSSYYRVEQIELTQYAYPLPEGWRRIWYGWSPEFRILVVYEKP